METKGRSKKTQAVRVRYTVWLRKREKTGLESKKRKKNKDMKAKRDGRSRRRAETMEIGKTSERLSQRNIIEKTRHR